MNEDKFTGKAELYAKYRPSYPDKLIEWLYETTHAESVADIGAGTGIFTLCLAAKPWKITAVEPNADMLKQLEITLEGKAEIICAPAESTGLPDNSVGLVTAAQAFHWFDEERFKAECMRILNRNGMTAIVWNGRSSCGLNDERTEICRALCPAFREGHVGKRSEAEGDAFFRNDYFSRCEYTEFDNIVTADRESFIGDLLSRSYAPRADEETYPVFIEKITALFEKYSSGGFVTIPYKTTCYLGSFS